MRNLTVELGVHVVVRIKQVEFDTTHVHLPYISVYLIVREWYINDNLVSGFVKETFDRQAIEVQSFIVSDLLAVHRKRLGEIAITIEQADTTHVDIAVRSFLQIISGKNSETSGIYLQHMRKAILHTEISHRRALRIGLFRHIVAEYSVNSINARHEAFILGKLRQTVVAQTIEQFDRILTDFTEKVFVKTAEEIERFVVPAPPKVVSHYVELLQRFGNAGFHRDHSPTWCVGIACHYVHIALRL